MTLYLDTSALVPLFLAEARSADIERAILSDDKNVAVSDFAIGEFGAAISKAVRMERLTNTQAEMVLNNFDAWTGGAMASLATAPADIRLASAFVRQFDLKLLLPDAIHIATCRQHGFKLMTFDSRQADAAAALGVAVVLP